MRTSLFFLLFLAFSSNACATILRHDHDKNEYNANEADYPYLFALYTTKQGHRDCIATLIAPDWAITAAHCTEDKPFIDGLAKDGYAIIVGGQKKLIIKAFHNGAKTGGGRDLALLHLDGPVTNVTPMRLYEDHDEVGRTVLIPGWGSFGNGIDGIKGADGIFRVAENIVDAAADGWLIWRFDDPRSRIQRALAYEGISGPGDSGGPALIVTAKGIAVAGVSSGQRTYGRPEGVYGAEEYFVRVSDFVSWIRQTMEKN